MIVGDGPRCVGKVVEVLFVIRLKLWIFSNAPDSRLWSFPFQCTLVWGCNPHSVIEVMDVFSSMHSDLGIKSSQCKQSYRHTSRD